MSGKIGVWETYIDPWQACQQLSSNSSKILVVNFTLISTVAFKFLKIFISYSYKAVICFSSHYSDN